MFSICWKAVLLVSLRKALQIIVNYRASQENFWHRPKIEILSLIGSKSH